jgi:two-component system response regulator PilR (NtrC family)
MSRPQVLVVDDEPDIRELLEMTLERMDVVPHSVADLRQARTSLARQPFAVCLTDMRLPDGNGIELVEYIQHNHPQVPVAVITAHGNMEAAVAALKAGAFDFVSKPVDLQILRNLVSTALRLSLKHPENPLRGSSDLLGNSPAIRKTRETIAKLARSQAPVYISGESGTGKELVARLIHDKGPRADKPFVPVNCGAIPEHLMESEFFGHKKGSFTGATADKPGLFQAAQGGTLFLDEVADLPLHMQVKLLRVIQEKAVRSIGEQKEHPIDCRVLSATHKDLARLVEQNVFRQDLFYRINVIEIHVPSLRERPEDIPLLADHVLQRLSDAAGMPCPAIASEAMDVLRGYDFPGNVRELENILERAMTLCDGDVIKAHDLRLPAQSGPQVQNAGKIPLEPYLNDVERERIVHALEQTRYNKTAAAKLLGVTFGTLRYRLKKLGLD